MLRFGFLKGVACPCLSVHPGRKLCCSVHGDDFTTAGPKAGLDWFEAELERRYELTRGGRLGPGPCDAKEATVLNRVVRWTPGGLENEADPRQGETLVEELGLQRANSCATPGAKLTKPHLEAEKELPIGEHTAFRGMAARGNYLAADRPDVHFACKGMCRIMAKPTDVGS